MGPAADGVGAFRAGSGQWRDPPIGGIGAPRASAGDFATAALDALIAERHASHGGFAAIAQRLKTMFAEAGADRSVRRST